MGLIVDYDELESLEISISTTVNEWLTALESVSNAVKQLSISPNMEGQAANNVK